MAREIVSDLILADFAFELVLGGTGIVDDRSDLPVNRAVWSKMSRMISIIVGALSRCVANGNCHLPCVRRESAGCRRPPPCPDTR